MPVPGTPPTPRRRAGRATLAVCAFALGALVLTAGCAQQRARRHLEDVAKGWCETIRASQVLPVYPLTEDLQPGDVFLVQTPIASQARVYRQRGFLALDDRRARLPGLDYKKAYFDHYWKDEFGAVPHERILRPGAGPLPGGGGGPGGLTEARAPRAAFPTYAFAARSGFGLAAAIPVKGIPVGLNYLRTDQVRGSVTIADARTYAADEMDLLGRLRAWAGESEVRAMLAETVEKAQGRPVYLRVVSRVYLTGSVLVSLNRSDTTAAEARGGQAPKVSLIDANGKVDENYTKALEALNQPESNPVTALRQAGAAVKFIGASESSVTLAESFDRLLAIGYLGLDVPVYPGGDLGAPVPTAQRLSGDVPEPPATRVEPLTTEQARFKVSEAALDALAAANPDQAGRVMNRVIAALGGTEFKDARAALEAMRAATQPADKTAAFNRLLAAYKEAALDYVTLGGNRGRRYAAYDTAFALAFDQRDRD